MSTSKQLRTIPDFFNTSFYRNSVGFDHMLNQLLNPTASITSAYPPYNITRQGDQYIVTMAVAGFSARDIDVTVEKGNLKIVGNIQEKLTHTDEFEVLHQGIAERNFERSFKLAEHVVVTEANLKNGLLTITMHQEIPDAHKLQRITINQ